MEVWRHGGLEAWRSGVLEALETLKAWKPGGWRPPVRFTDAKACGLWYSGGLNDTEAYGRPGVIGVL